MPDPETIRALAELVVRFGANVQPGQIVAVSSEPGKEVLARAVADVAYEQQAKFVDLTVFDVHVKRSRLLHADPETLDFVPPWYGARMRALGEHRCARIALTGPAAPHALEGIDPARAGRDMLPAIREGMELLNARSTNWSATPCPTIEWAKLVHPELGWEEALELLWREIAHICRLDEPDPVAVWTARLDALESSAAQLTERRFDALRFQGPGTDLTIGLLPGSRWHGARMTTADGIVHAPNLPTEEVFTTPDPARVDGVVRATKPLFVAGALIEGIRVEFRGGRAVSIDADQGAETLRVLAARDEGAARLGEVALVDREGRIGPLDTVFFDTLLDENAASHIAFGQGFEFTVDESDHGAINRSQIHIDFMIGGDDVAVTGVTATGEEVPVLRDGAWRI
ncbi:MAG TPA: aminopeptidase [Solirubrobacteraceae bacterium]|jgi:aminopeptidase|nr:aminopeptidase [Solirubrobacteraceae bacterium]